MANPYFQFKQFTVYQDRCAMKVGTDGVLLGAWTDVSNVNRILDAGTGTGLVALMLAQRTGAQIDAIEIDEAACAQAADNISASPWADRIDLHHQSLQSYAKVTPRRYELIVSNPPYYPVSGWATVTNAAARSRRVAREQGQLAMADLFKAAAKLLAATGRLVVIYPQASARAVQTLAQEYGFRCQKCLQVQPKHHLPVKRVVLDFERSGEGDRPPGRVEALVLEEPERYVYTPEFVALIRDYYLNY